MYTTGPSTKKFESSMLNAIDIICSMNLKVLKYFHPVDWSKRVTHIDACSVDTVLHPHLPRPNKSLDETCTKGKKRIDLREVDNELPMRGIYAIVRLSLEELNSRATYRTPGWSVRATNVNHYTTSDDLCVNCG